MDMERKMKFEDFFIWEMLSAIIFVSGLQMNDFVVIYVGLMILFINTLWHCLSLGDKK